MCGGLACRCTVAYSVPIHPSPGHHITRCACHDFGTSEAAASATRARRLRARARTPYLRAAAHRARPVERFLRAAGGAVTAVAEDRSPEVLKPFLDSEP